MKSKTLFSLVVLTLFTSLIPAMHAQTFSVIHSFSCCSFLTEPMAGVTIRGNALYGTANPAAYELTNTGSSWLFSPIAALSFGFYYPSRPVFGPDGHLYSTSSEGGKYNYGTIFKLTPPVGVCKTVACYWTVNVLHDFGSGTDAIGPGHGDLIWDQQANIYGTTTAGGTSQNCNGFGCGAVYELTPSGNGYTESVLYSFSGPPDGEYPQNGLVFDNKGNLFGTTPLGDSNNFGTVFELTYVMGVGWTEQVIYNFQNASDGQFAQGGLVFDSAGNLYGATPLGGSGGAGTVFELSPSGNTWTFKLLYSFSGNGDGPLATLTMDGAGNLYGTTFSGGLYSNGSVFKLSNTENGWVYTSLHDFTGGADGGPQAYGGVTIGSDGTLYGTIAQGGIYGGGTLWMIKP